MTTAGVPTLPTDPDRLHDLLGRASAAVAACRRVLADLACVEAAPEEVRPIVICSGEGPGYSLEIVDGGRDTVLWLCQSAVEAATACSDVLEWMSLSGTRQTDIRKIAAAAARPANLLPVGPVEVRTYTPVVGVKSGAADTKSVVAGGLNEHDQARVKALIGLFEAAAEAAEALQTRLERKAHPPGIRERISVDRNTLVVVFDGHSFSNLTERQATLFHYLIEAEGKVVSGVEIAQREGIGEFKGALARRQLVRTHPPLARLIRVAKRGRRGFFLELPPTD